jgi:deazaflavin-dependent oxidoreductase (nitroreductase family)
MSEQVNFNEAIIEEFRSNKGVVGGRFAGAPLLLLHSKGAKSGQIRVNPMMYQQVPDGYAVFGSRGGSDSHPDWYYNLLANPDAEIEVGEDTVAVCARVLEGDERETIWTEQKKRYKAFADYEAGTSRVIPVILLEPVS